MSAPTSPADAPRLTPLDDTHPDDDAPTASATTFEPDAHGGGDAPAEGDEPDWMWWGRRALSFGIVAACCIYVFVIVHGHTLVLTDTTPTGGDMGAHVWGPAYLRDHLLPNLRLTGWTQDWYAGFPAYTFYMVLPSIFIVGLDVGVIPMDHWWGQLLAVVLGGALVAGWALVRGRLGRTAWALTGLAGIVGYVLLLDVPYNVAFKLVTIAGLVAFPAAVWYLLSGLSLRQPGPELGAIASVMFLMDRSLFHIYGGNIASTMAGEFAFSLSITLALFALGTIARGLATGRYRATSAALIAAAALCHVIPAIFMAFGALFLLLLRPRVRSVLWALPVGITGFLLAMFWYVPFYLQSDYLNDMGWEKLGVIQCNGQNQWSWHEILRNLLPFAPHTYVTCDGPGATPQTFTDPNMLHGRVIFVLAVVGAVMSLVMVVRAGIWLTTLTAFSATAFMVMPQHRFWNARVLPFYYLCVFLLAAVGVYLAVRAVSLVLFGTWRVPGLWTSVGVSVGAALVVYTALALTIGGWLPGGVERVEAANGQPARWRWLGLESAYEGVGGGWAKWNFEGLEHKPGSQSDPKTGLVIDNHADSDEYFAMVDTMRKVGRDRGCGRAFWEYDGDLNKYGTPMAPMLLPYFTDGCIGSMEGLYFEASSTTPFHFMVQSELSQSPSRPQRFPSVGVNPEDAPEGFNGSWPYRNFDVDQGIRHLQMLGVRYFMTYKDPTEQAAAADSRLKKVASSGPWTVFEVRDAALVTPLENLPNRWTDVADDIHSWARPAVEWFSDPGSWSIYRSSGGPRSWPAIRAGEEPVRRRAPAPDLQVSDVRQTEDSISFHVSEVGSPVLVKTSYFPNWEVEGADGPYRVAPNQMVVIPTSKTVVMTYGRSGVEVFGWLLTFVGLAVLVLLARRRVVFEGPPAEFFGDRDGPSPQDDAEPEGADHEQLTIPFGSSDDRPGDLDGVAAGHGVGPPTGEAETPPGVGGPRSAEPTPPS